MMIHKYSFGMLFVILAACGAIKGENVPATLQIENDSLATEAAASADTILDFQTAVQATAEYAETLVVEMNNINRQLVATVRAGQPPTVGAIVANQGGLIRFGATLVGSSIDGNGCVDVQQREYFLGTFGSIYISAQAFNLSAGSRIAIELREEGVQMLRESWDLQQNINGECIWTAVESGRVPLASGKRWTGQFFVDGQPVQPPAVFVILSSATQEAATQG